jgi:hypothetical protein
LKFLPEDPKNACYFTVLIIITILLSLSPCYSKEEEETYNISLVKTADVGKANQVHEVEGKKVLAETYTVKDGEHLWQLLRERKLLEKRNLSELISMLKKLNSSLGNIDMIHPGDKIIIPLVISPIGAVSAPSKASPPVEAVPLAVINDVDLEDYVVQQGDSIIKIVEEHYDIPPRELYNQYLSKLKELNPFIKDLNSVYPGQKIKLPIYSRKVLRMPIKEQPVVEPMTVPQKEAIKVMAVQLGEIFTLLGEQWIQSGEHFFPFKTSGQLKLNAATYPIIDLASGRKVIVDLYNDLPEKMETLITSNWDEYAIIHLDGKDDLKQAFDRIVQICGYEKTLSSSEPYVSGGDFPIRITADRIVMKDQRASSPAGGIFVFNFLDENSVHTPEALRKWLESTGIKIIDYPSLPEAKENAGIGPDVLDAQGDLNSFIITLLDMAGQKYATDVELPVYQSEKADINLAIKADISFQADGRDHVIDLSGLGKDIIKLLQEHQIEVFSVSRKRSSAEILAGLLDFLNIKYDAGTHQFSSAGASDSHSVSVSIDGVAFRDPGGKDIFATSLKLPQELIAFLNMKGYRVLIMSAVFSAPDNKTD